VGEQTNECNTYLCIICILHISFSSLYPRLKNDGCRNEVGLTKEGKLKRERGKEEMVGKNKEEVGR